METLNEVYCHVNNGGFSAKLSKDDKEDKFKPNLQLEFKLSSFWNDAVITLIPLWGRNVEGLVEFLRETADTLESALTSGEYSLDCGQTK
jgi:hypothetical protein